MGKGKGKDKGKSDEQVFIISSMIDSIPYDNNY